jgi:hypothetical protein
VPVHITIKGFYMVKYFVHTYQGSHGQLDDWYATANGVVVCLGEAGGTWWRQHALPPNAQPATKKQFATWLDELAQEDGYIASLAPTILAHVPSTRDMTLDEYYAQG